VVLRSVSILWEVTLLLLEMSDIKKEYVLGPQKILALNGVSLSIDQGEFVSIMGASGSGKSTLLNIIGCLDLPTEGRYRIRGDDVSSFSEGRLADLRNLAFGFVFQTYRLMPRISARRNVEIPLIYRGYSAKERRERAIQALVDVGLEDRIEHKPTQLSGGQQQRVAIARALVGDPALILADEPTGNLDSKTGEEIMGIFQRLHEKRALTVVQVTHDPFMARHGTRLIQIKDGEIEGDSFILDRVFAEEILA